MDNHDYVQIEGKEAQAMIDLGKEGYKEYAKHQIWITALLVLFSVAFIGSITFLTWHFNNPKLMFWYLVPALCYCVG